MLRDGKFIKEPPIVIGSHYVPEYHKDKNVSEEEEVMQDILLGGTEVDTSVEDYLLYFFLVCAAIYTIIYLIT
jgi:hypothetical protein